MFFGWIRTCVSLSIGKASLDPSCLNNYTRSKGLLYNSNSDLLSEQLGRKKSKVQRRKKEGITHEEHKERLKENGEKTGRKKNEEKLKDNERLNEIQKIKKKK